MRNQLIGFKVRSQQHGSAAAGHHVDGFHLNLFNYLLIGPAKAIWITLCHQFTGRFSVYDTADRWVNTV